MPCVPCIVQCHKRGQTSHVLPPDVGFPLSAPALTAMVQSGLTSTHYPLQICSCGTLFCPPRAVDAQMPRLDRDLDTIDRALEGTGLRARELFRQARAITEPQPIEEQLVRLWTEGTGSCPGCFCSTSPIATPTEWYCSRCGFRTSKPVPATEALDPAMEGQRLKQKILSLSASWSTLSEGRTWREPTGFAERVVQSDQQEVARLVSLAETAMGRLKEIVLWLDVCLQEKDPLP